MPHLGLRSEEVEVPVTICRPRGSFPRKKKNRRKFFKAYITGCQPVHVPPSCLRFRPIPIAYMARPVVLDLRLADLYFVVSERTSS